MQRLASRPLVLLALVASLLAVTTAVTGAGPTLDLLRRSGGPPAPADSPTGAGGARVPQALIAWLDSGPPGRLLAQGGPTLSASPLSIGPGGIETAIWSGISNPTAGDWIGLYAAGAADTDREYGYILTGGTASGSAGYQLPSTLAAGTYELRLFANYSWTRLAVSNSFTVPTLSASPLSMGPGGIETATWSGISNPQAGDWIGLYAAGAPDSPQTYGYILTGGTASGTAGYQLPSTLPPGTYELRLFANSSWLRLAVSNAFTVPSLSASPTGNVPGAVETATWSGISNPQAGDWIGLYATGAADTDREYGYILTGGTASGSAGYQLPLNLAGGTYELRLFANYSWTRLAVSNAFTIASLAAAPATVDAGQIEIASWSNVPNPQAGDWIGLYASGAADTDREYGYIYTGGTASGSAGYQLPTDLPSGTYELRLFANGTWSRVAVSNAFTVTGLPVEPPPAGTDHNPPLINAETGGSGVNTYTGAYSYSHTDVAIAGRGPAPQFTRAYNSNDTRVGPLGPGWTHSYAMRLVRPASGSTSIVLVGPQGRSDTYTRQADGSYAPPAGVFATLAANTNGTYTVTAKDLTVWTFDPLGHLGSISDRYGNTAFLGYDGSGHLTSISDPAGRGSLSLDYYANGRLKTVTDWASPARVVTYGYDANGRLNSVLDRQNALLPSPQPLTSYGYDASGRLSALTNPNGHTLLSITYDPTSGRVASQYDALGSSNLTTFGYNNGVTTVTQPSTTFDGAHPTTTDTYNASGWLISRVVAPSANASETMTTSYGYDALGDRTASTDSFGNTTTYCYDVDYSGAAVAGSRGNLTRKIQPTVSVQASPSAPLVSMQPTTLYTYDANNNLVETYPPKGVTTGTGVTCTTALNGSLNSTYRTTRTYDDPVHGIKLLATTQSFTDPDLGGQTATTQYQYNDAANPGAVTGIVSPRGNTTTYAYYQTGSQAGLQQSKTTPPTPDLPNGATTSYSYDAVGRRLTQTDPLQQTWTYSYDNEDRQLTVTSPPVDQPTLPYTGLVTTYGYDPAGNRTSSTDARNPRQTTRYLYDGRELLQQVRQAVTPGADPSIDSYAIWTTYSYDNLGGLQHAERATLPEAQGGTAERAFDYHRDGLGRVRVEYQWPNWPSTAAVLFTLYGYDANGNQIGVTRPKDVQQPPAYAITSSYDALNRRTGITYADGATPNASYTYDAHGKRVTMSPPGTIGTTYQYDERDQLTLVTFPGGQQVGYRYDLDGHRRKLIYPPDAHGNPVWVTYNIDAAGRLASLDDWAQPTRHTAYQYRADGKLAQITNFNGTLETFAYDNAGRTTSVTNQHSDGRTITQDVYTLDGLGNATSTAVNAEFNPTSDTWTYQYDGLNRLQHFNDTSGTLGTLDYTYDTANNRQTLNQNGLQFVYTYDGADRLLTINEQATATDNNGNLLSRPGMRYQYDQADRLTQITAGSGGNQCIGTSGYDGDGRRVSHLTTGSCLGSNHTYVDDVSGALPQLLEDGALYYVRGAGLAYSADINTGVASVYHTDSHGSVRAITDQNGTLVQNYRYDPSGVQTAAGTSPQSLGYTGEPQDPDNGLVYLRARSYDPAIGRFLERDSLLPDPKNPDSLNRYTYAGNNPSSNTDPSGHDFGCPVCGLPGFGRLLMPFGFGYGWGGYTPFGGFGMGSVLPPLGYLPQVGCSAPAYPNSGYSYYQVGLCPAFGVGGPQPPPCIECFGGSFTSLLGGIGGGLSNFGGTVVNTWNNFWSLGNAGCVAACSIGLAAPTAPAVAACTAGTEGFGAWACITGGAAAVGGICTIGCSPNFWQFNQPSCLPDLGNLLSMYCGLPVTGQ